MDYNEPSPLIGALLDIRASGGRSAGPHHASHPQSGQPQAPPTQAAEHQAPPSTPAQRQTIPSAWRLLFHSKHADGEVYKGLFQACRAGIRVALREAPHLTVHYRPYTTSWRTDSEFSHIDAVYSALAMRGQQSLPCTLVVHVSCYWPSLDELTDAVLGEASVGVVELRLCREDSENAWLPTADKTTVLLRTAADALPNLHTLHLTVPITTLPPPSSLKKLTSLTLQLSGSKYPNPEDKQVCESLQPLIAQLTQLQILTEISAQKEVAWELVFPAPSAGTATQRTPYTNLTHLTTDARLTHALIGMLLEQVPGLKRLSVGHVGLGPPAVDWDGDVEPIYSHEEWGLESLHVTRESITAEKLCYLPRKGGQGRTEVGPRGGFVYLAAGDVDAPGLDPELRSRLHEWRFITDTVVVRTFLKAAEQLVVLPAVLSQLHSVQAAAATLHLDGWLLNADSQPAVASSLPTLPFAHFKLSLNQPLTDEVLGHLVAVAAHMRKVHVPSLDLQSDQHTNTPWPWDELSIDTVDVACLPLLPNPRGGGEAGRGVVFTTLDFTHINEANALTLADWLPHITWQPRPHHHPVISLGHASRWSFAPPPPPPAPPPHASLRAQLSLLPALRLPITPDENLVDGNRFGFAPEQDDGLCVCVNAPMTHDVMQCLQCLPAWPVRLDFCSMDWPLPHTEYAQLAEYVPIEYTLWWLPGQSDTAGGGIEDFPWARVEQICAGVNARRSALQQQSPAETDRDTASSGAQCEPQSPADTDSAAVAEAGHGAGSGAQCETQSPASLAGVTSTDSANGLVTHCELQSPADLGSPAYDEHDWYSSGYEGPLPLRLLVGSQEREITVRGMGEHVVVWGVCDAGQT